MEQQIVWLAEWNNGQDYEDNYTQYVGVYSTQEKAKIAVEAYDKKQIEEGNTYNPGQTSCYVYRVVLDEQDRNCPIRAAPFPLEFPR